MAEFQYNNHIYFSTKQTPFLLDIGRHPRMGFEPLLPAWLKSVNNFSERMKAALLEAAVALTQAKEDMAHYYNQRHLPTPMFQAGDKVFLDTSDIHTSQPSRKLAHRRLGPYSVEQQVSKNAYRLLLPHSMQHLHPVFNVVKLTCASSDLILGRQPKHPPPPEIIDDKEEYLVEEVLNSRMF